MKRIRSALSLAFDGLLAIIALWGLIALIGFGLVVALAFIWALISAFR